MILRKLLLLTTAITLGLVALGAYVRLKDAGLGCPDWPGCYGHLTVPNEAHELAHAQATFPDKPVEAQKAWIEMAHRYVASGVGLLIIAILVISFWQRASKPRGWWLPAFLLGFVIFQGILGKWTVTWLLKPVVVTAHLLGGMIILGLLIWLSLREFRSAFAPRIMASPGLRMLGWVALAVLFTQIALGGWVSTNYAALACSDLPRCQSEWWPSMDFAQAFQLRRELGMTATGELLSNQALTAIHLAHRIGAVLATIVIGALGVALLRRHAGLGFVLLGALALQVLLGVSNVLLSLPLPLAVAHNAGAALLVIVLVAANYRFQHG